MRNVGQRNTVDGMDSVANANLLVQIGLRPWHNPQHTSASMVIVRDELESQWAIRTVQQHASNVSLSGVSLPRSPSWSMRG